MSRKRQEKQGQESLCNDVKKNNIPSAEDGQVGGETNPGCSLHARRTQPHSLVERQRLCTPGICR